MTTKEMIEVMQAYERGEQIEYKVKTIPENNNWYLEEELSGWDWAHFEYRVKPQFTYRSYKNADEFLAAQKKHGMWLMCKRITGCFMPVKIINLTIEICSCSAKGLYAPKEISFKELLNNYTWQDGMPCGVKE